MPIFVWLITAMLMHQIDLNICKCNFISIIVIGAKVPVVFFCLNTNKQDVFNIVISPFNIEVKYNTEHIQSFDYNIVHIIVIKGYPEIVCLKTKRELYIY